MRFLVCSKYILYWSPEISWHLTVHKVLQLQHFLQTKQSTNSTQHTYFTPCTSLLLLNEVMVWPPGWMQVLGILWQLQQMNWIVEYPKPLRNGTCKPKFVPQVKLVIALNTIQEKSNIDLLIQKTNRSFFSSSDLKATKDKVKNYSITDSKTRIFFLITIPIEWLNFPQGASRWWQFQKYAFFQKPLVSLHSYWCPTKWDLKCGLIPFLLKTTHSIHPYTSFTSLLALRSNWCTV